MGSRSATTVDAFNTENGTIRYATSGEVTLHGLNLMSQGNV